MQLGLFLFVLIPLLDDNLHLRVQLGVHLVEGPVFLAN